MASNLYTAPVATVSGIHAGAPATWDEVRIERIHLPVGAQYGKCTLRFPKAYGFEDLPALGGEIVVTYDESVMFRGRAISYPGSVSLIREDQVLEAADARWELNRMKIGQYGIGPQDEDRGGFSELGHQVHFNPGGFANRSAIPDGETGVYTFFTGPGARFWTRKDIFGWTMYWYVKTIMSMEPAELSASWDYTEPNRLVYGMPLARAINILARKCGETWGVRFDEAGTYYVPVAPVSPSTLTVTLDLPLPTSGALAVNTVAPSVQVLQGTQSIENSCDSVEAHANQSLAEHTYLSFYADPLLVAMEADAVPEPFVYGYRVDVEKYAAALLGKNRLPGARPKRWWRHNVTRKVPDGDEYYEAMDPDLLANRGLPLLPGECLWVAFGDDDDGYRLKRLKSGFRIDLENCEILFADTLVFMNNEKAAVDADWWDDKNIAITVATELEARQIHIEETPPEISHIDPEHRIAELIYRSDLRTLVRHQAFIPDLDDDNDYTEISPGAEDLDLYVSVQQDLEDSAAAYFDARSPQAISAMIRTVGINTDVRLGQNVTVTPANVGLSGDEIITDIRYDPARGDHMVLSVTNQLARVLIK